MSAITGRSLYLESGGMPSGDTSEFDKRLANQMKLAQVVRSCNRSAILQQMKVIGTKSLVTSINISCIKNTDIKTHIVSAQHDLQFYQLR